MRPARLPRPAVQHRQGPGAHAPAHGARRPRATARASRARATARRCSAARRGGTPTTTTWGSSRRGSARRGASSPPTGRCSSTSTRARRTTARCCSTSSSAARRSSTRSCGPTTTARGRAARWPAKHDVIFWYARDPARYVFRYDDIDRVPYLAPGLVGPEKAARGKTPTDVWWQTIVSPTGDGEDRLPDAEAGQDPRAHRARPLGPGRPRRRPVRRQRHDGRGGGAAGPASTCWWTRTPRRCASCASASRGTGRRSWTRPARPTAPPGGRRRRPSRPPETRQGPAPRGAGP